MMKSTLTGREAEMMAFIELFIHEHGYPPSVRDLAKGMGVSSQNGIFEHLKNLERKGYIARDPKIARSIRLVRR